MRLQPGLVMPGGLVPASAGPAGKTYTQFIAHITAKAVDGTVAWYTQPTGAANNNKSRMTTGEFVATGNMYGSPWLGYTFNGGAQINRIIQHSFPSYAKFLETTNVNDQVYFHTTVGAATDYFQAVDRNSYPSLEYSDGNSYSSMFCDEVIYFDRGLGKAMKMNPQAGTGPVEYTF